MAGAANAVQHGNERHGWAKRLALPRIVRLLSLSLFASLQLPRSFAVPIAEVVPNPGIYRAYHEGC